MESIYGVLGRINLGAVSEESVILESSNILPWYVLR